MKTRLQTLIAPIVEGLGFQLWGIEYIPQQGQSIVRMYIDKPEVGVTLDECGQVSQQIGAVLAVEEIISGSYRLEVSSPGLDRTFFTYEQMRQYIDKTIRIRLKHKIDEQRKLVGTLIDLQDGQIYLKMDEQVYHVDFADIEKANLVWNKTTCS